MEYWNPDPDFQGYLYHMLGDQEQVLKDFKRHLQNSTQFSLNSAGGQ